MLSDKHSSNKTYESKAGALEKTDNKIYKLVTKGHEREQNCQEYHEGIFKVQLTPYFNHTAAKAVFYRETELKQ